MSGTEMITGSLVKSSHPLEYKVSKLRTYYFPKIGSRISSDVIESIHRPAPGMLPASVFVS